MAFCAPDLLYLCSTAEDAVLEVVLEVTKTSWQPLFGELKAVFNEFGS